MIYQMKTQTQQNENLFYSYPEKFIKVSAWYRITEREVNGIVKKVYYSGSVTVENGKMKLSIDNRNYHSWSAKIFIEQTVREQFFNYRTSPIFLSFTEVKNDLIAELRNATQDLKANYFEKCEQSSERIFTYTMGQIEQLRVEMDELQSVIRSKAKIVDGYGTREYWNLRTKFSALMKQYDNAVEMREGGYDKFLKEEMERAERHYESSLVKLAARLVAKGVEGDMTISSGRVGHNFEVYIKHNKGITRAWTIIAEGPIVRAHYRYLVK